MPLAAPVTSATRVSRSELLMSLGRYPLRHLLQAGGVPGRLLRWMCAVPPAARRAEVAESVDAHDSGSCVREDMWVQVPPSAPDAHPAQAASPAVTAGLVSFSASRSRLLLGALQLLQRAQQAQHGDDLVEQRQAVAPHGR